ncbi:MAG: hypothetical protein EOO38_15515 [Cytophagaceae bacterium]|nr:MAG: hypothetical protein EOO38_15515 [Cytophagaceae bacterium]
MDTKSIGPKHDVQHAEAVSAGTDDKKEVRSAEELDRLKDLYAGMTNRGPAAPKTEIPKKGTPRPGTGSMQEGLESARRRMQDLRDGKTEMRKPPTLDEIAKFYEAMRKA